MLTIENTEVFGWEAAIRGARNPMNSWDRMDSNFSCESCEGCTWENNTNFVDKSDEYMYDVVTWCKHSPCKIGENDMKLMKNLAKAGSDHAKYLRMINVTMDVTAMQPWWMEFDTYKIGTVRNSCSKMHKIHVKEFTADDFEHRGIDETDGFVQAVFIRVIEVCNYLRAKFNETQEKKYWRALIELLPEGYLMRATVQLNYEVLRHQYHARKNHKLVEWHEYCDWIRSLPYAKELIIGEECV